MPSNPCEDAKAGDGEKNGLASLDSPWPWNFNVHLEYLRWIKQCLAGLIRVGKPLRNGCCKWSTKCEVLKCKEDPVSGRADGPETGTNLQEDLRWPPGGYVTPRCKDNYNGEKEV